MSFDPDSYLAGEAAAFDPDDYLSPAITEASPTEVQDKGIMSKVADAFTGGDRMTAQQRELPELTSSGLLQGQDRAAVAAVTPALMTATNPDEIVNIVTSNFPDVAATYNLDAQGDPYPILTNRKTGAVSQINRPGLSGIDLLQGGALAAAFTPAGKATGALLPRAGALAAKGGATSAGIEGTQAVSGGEFDATQVAMDTALGGLFDPALELAKKTGRPVGDAFKALAKRLGHTDDEIVRAGTQLNVYVNGMERRVQPEVDLTQAGAQRTARAADQGVMLTQAQANKDFAAQEAEQTLLASATSEGVQAREAQGLQQEQLRDLLGRESGGSSRLQQTIGAEPDVSVSSQNESIRKALTDSKDLSGQQVRDLYNQAADTPGDAIPLSSELILDAADEAIVGMPTEPTVKTAIEKALAKFGLIGQQKVDDAGELVTRGRNRTLIEDNGQTIEILGPVTPLNLNNSEAFRKELNKAVGADTTGAAKQVVRALDGVVEDAASTLADPVRKEAFESARKGAASKAQTFKAKDIVQELTSYKPGTRTPKVTTQDIINSIVKGKGSLDNTKAVLKAMARYPTATAETAKKALSSETLGDIFSQSINKDTLEVSGARLNSAIKRYDVETLKLVLGAEGYKKLLRTRDIVGDATIPLPNTGNPSGTAYKIMNSFVTAGNWAGLGQVNFGTLALQGIKKGKEIKNRKQTLKNITENKLQGLQDGAPIKSSTVREFARLASMLELRELETQRQQEQQATNTQP